MELTKEEKQFLRTFVEEELKRVHKEKKEMKQLRPVIPFIAVEEKYDSFLEKLKKKLE